MDAHPSLLHRVANATVTVLAEVSTSHPSAPILGTQRIGSGTVVASDGVIVTVNYVVLGAGPVTIIDIDGRQHEGRVVAQDFASGLAVIRSTAAGLPVIKAGTSADVEIGDDVMTVASVGGSERRSAWGAVTSREAFDANWEYRLEQALWATGISPGPSGGPLCDSRGRMVGIVSMNMGSLARSLLAVPSENYYAHADELLTHGQRVTRPPRAWVGLFCSMSVEGTKIIHLVAEGPGEVAGLRVDDVIVRADGVQVSSHGDLYARIWEHKPGEQLELYVYRSGQLLTINVEGGDAQEFFA